MYTTPAAGRARRSAQTAMYHIAEPWCAGSRRSCRFTAEEIWQLLPGRARGIGVSRDLASGCRRSPPPTSTGRRCCSCASDVTRELEKLRDAGSIGAPLDAEVDVYCVPEEYARFNALGEELRFLLITSDARVHRLEGAPPADAVPATDTGRGGVWVAVKPTSDPKCVRCWHHRPDVGANPKHPEICGRCVSNVDGPGEERRFV